MSDEAEMGGPVSMVSVRVETAGEGAIEAAWDALRGVCDPELCLDVVSLGLVYAVGYEDGVIVVEMTLTTPGCPASESLQEMARAAVAEATGHLCAVDVRIVWDPPWSPALMEEEAAAAHGFRGR